MPSFPTYLLSGGRNDPHKAMLGPDTMAAIPPTSREDLEIHHAANAGLDLIIGGNMLCCSSKPRP